MKPTKPWKNHYTGKSIYTSADVITASHRLQTTELARDILLAAVAKRQPLMGVKPEKMVEEAFEMAKHFTKLADAFCRIEDEGKVNAQHSTSTLNQ